LLDPSATTADLDVLLRELVSTQASDLHLKPGRPPLIRVNGLLTPLKGDALDPGSIREMLLPAVPPRLRKQLESDLAIDFGYGVPGLSRFRASVFFQRGTLAAVFRRVPFNFPSLSDWGLPSVLNEICNVTQGLVLMTGPTGSGKSSTLAAMMQEVVNSRQEHIVTIEDPIEFLINDDLGSVSQREIGIDTPSFSAALRNVLRQDPDVIMVGEMRDEETIRTVITAAETGHLVFSTLHTNDAVQTIDRIISSFPESNHHQVRQQLSSCLEAVVSMQLVPRADGTGMAAAVEILRKTPPIQKLILDGDYQALQETLETSVSFHRMQSMNQSLLSLIVHGTITKETAMTTSTNPSELDLLLRRLIGAGEKNADGDDMTECTSDFSKILKLQEVQKHYDELQARHAEEIAARDSEIRRLRDEVPDPAQPDSSEADALRAENERLADQIKVCREEYESKIERLNARLKSTQAKRAAGAPAPQETAKKGGFFRR